MKKKMSLILMTFSMVGLFASPGWGRDGKGAPRPLRPVSTCGWLENTAAGDGLSSGLQQGMEELGVENDAGSVSVHIRSVGDHPIIVWCITREQYDVGEEMVKDLAMSFEKPVPGEDSGDPVVADKDRTPGGELSTMFRYLGKAGYDNYVKSNIDLVFLYSRPFRCSLLGQGCLGEAKCEFNRTASLVIHGMDPVDAAALWVHEAAHLEGCYNTEEYAREKERDFRERLGRLPQ